MRPRKCWYSWLETGSNVGTVLEAVSHRRTNVLAWNYSLMYGVVKSQCRRNDSKEDSIRLENYDMIFTLKADSNDRFTIISNTRKPDCF